MSTHANLKIKSKLYFYAADVTDVYDGDTLTVDLDLGLGTWQRNLRIRLWKINAPELRGAEREEGLRVRDFVRGLILDNTVLIRTILDKRGKDRTGKFGRLLGEVLIEGDAGEVVNVNELLLEKGLVAPMDSRGTTIERAVPTDARPEQILCPFCGEVRRVEGAMVEKCPNCLDEASPLARFW